MKSSIRLAVLLLLGMVAIGGCSAVRSLFGGESGALEAPAAKATAQPSAPRFTFFDSWASW